MKIEGFKKVDYNTLQSEMKKVYNSDEVPEIQIASQINVKSVQTVKNAFNLDLQTASDEVLTKVLDAIGIDSFVMWHKGERDYYIKNGKA